MIHAGPKQRLLAGALLASALLASTGCGPFRLPDLPTPITTPHATVERVERLDVTEDAATYRIHLRLDSDHHEALPMRRADYTLQIDDRSYRTDTDPNATVPARRALTIPLLAVIENGPPPGAPYQVSGSIQLDPPGQIKEFFYGLGWPRPRARFTTQGHIE